MTREGATEAPALDPRVLVLKLHAQKAVEFVQKD